MSPTLDEAATTHDVRYTEHVRRSAFLLAVNRAFEIDGMPAPLEVGFVGFNNATLRMDDNAAADVDDWAAHLGVEATAGTTVHKSNRMWRCYEAKAASFAGYEIEVWSAVDEPEQHEQVAGWAGAPGACGVECSCGIAFDNFDSIGEAEAQRVLHAVKA